MLAQLPDLTQPQYVSLMFDLLGLAALAFLATGIWRNVRPTSMPQPLQVQQAEVFASAADLAQLAARTSALERELQEAERRMIEASRQSVARQYEKFEAALEGMRKEQKTDMSDIRDRIESIGTELAALAGELRARTAT